MLAGHPPFRGATPHEVAAAVLHEEPPSLTRLPGVSAALDRVVTKMLRKNRDERYQDIRDVLVDLKELRAPATTSRRGWVGVAAVAAVIGLMATGAAYFWSSRAPVDTAVNAVAVLPLGYTGAADQMEYLADGLTESLISDLAQGTALRVMSRSSSFRFKGRTVDAQAAGRELNVDAVLAGRIEPRGDRLAISVELIAVADGRQLWGHQYSEAAGDILQLQVTLSRDVQRALQSRSTIGGTGPGVQPTTTDAVAYRLYLQGRFSWKQLTDAGVNKAIDYYLQALQRDPEFALAYVGLAESYIFLGTDSVPPREALPKASAYATKALSLKPDLADAHAAVGIIKLVYDWDWRGAAQELSHQHASSSQTVESFTCALHYADPLGRNDEATAALQSALAMDPLSLPANVELGCAAYYGRQFDRAIRQFRGTLTLYPNHPFATFELGRALAQTRDYAGSLAVLRPAETSSGAWPPIVSELAYANAKAGERREAERLLASLLAQRRRRFVDPYLVAGVHVALGQTDRAFAALNEAVDERSSYLPWLKVEPKWDPLRGDPRYPVLLRRVGLPL